MSSPTSISSDKLARLIGTIKAPTPIGARIDQDFTADPRLIPNPARRLCTRGAILPLSGHEVSDIKSIAEVCGAARIGGSDIVPAPRLQKRRSKAS